MQEFAHFIILSQTYDRFNLSFQDTIITDFWQNNAFLFGEREKDSVYPVGGVHKFFL